MLIFLIGYMGCGKSTIARKLSKRLGWQLIDTDGVIESRSAMSVAEIFDRQGEESFRGMERRLVEELVANGEDMIVSTGGGLPIWGDNMDLMNRSGLTIYIARTAENIASRLSPMGRAKRPKLRGLSDLELIDFMSRGIAEREVKYRMAHSVIEAVPLSDREILDRIETDIKQYE